MKAAAPLPPFTRVADKPNFLKSRGLRAVKFWWAGNDFVMGVVDDAPQIDKGDADPKR